MRKAIEQDTLKALIETASLREIQCTRGPGSEGFVLSARLAGNWLPIRSKRESIRIWASLTAIGKFCEKMGIKHLTVEL